MIRRFFAPALLLTLASNALAFQANAACDFGDDSPVTWVIYGLDRTPISGDATVSFRVTPLASPPAACDPEIDVDCDAACDPEVDVDCAAACDPEVDVDCDVPCDPDVDVDCDVPCDPEVDVDCDVPCDPDVDVDCDVPAEGPVVGSLVVPFAAATVMTLPSGVAELTISAPGFEDRVLTRSVCGPSRVRATLMPDRLVTLSLRVIALQEGGSVAGTTVTLEGIDERAGERHEAVLAADGTVSVSDIQAGFYAVSLRQTAGGVSQYVHLPMVDLLDDGKLSVRLRASDDLPDTKITCSMATGGAGSWAALLAGLALIGMRRRPTR